LVNHLILKITTAEMKSVENIYSFYKTFNKCVYFDVKLKTSVGFN